MLIHWTSYWSTASGSAAKYVRCKQCSAEYGYVLQLEVTGFAIAAFFMNERRAITRANERAAFALRRALNRGIEPHFCPKCYYLPQEMAKEVKRRYLKWISFRAMPLILLVAFLAFLVSMCIMIIFSSENLPKWRLTFLRVWSGIAIAIVLLPFVRLLLTTIRNSQKWTVEEMTLRGIHAGIALEEWDAEQDKIATEWRSMGETSELFRHARPRPESENEHIINAR